MNGEYSLDTNAVSNSAYGEGLSDTAMLLGDYSTLKGLDSLSVAFLDLNADTNSVTNVYDRKCHFFMQLSAMSFSASICYILLEIYKRSFPITAEDRLL